MKPAFLVHIPGDMEGNFAILEVKPITARGNATREDIDWLDRFVVEAGYHLPILLVFGGSLEDLSLFRRRAHQREGPKQAAQLGRIELWWHSAPGARATLVPWA